MNIYLESPTHRPGGPDGKGWNRLSLNAHMGTPSGRCALQPKDYPHLFESLRDTRHSQWGGGYGRCNFSGNCGECPLFTRKQLTMGAFTDTVMVRILERPGQTEDEAHLVNRPEDGWASSSYRWRWDDLRRLAGWTVGSRLEYDEHSAYFWLTKDDPTTTDGIRSPCEHRYNDWRFCSACRKRYES